jgi:hypothetical protein
MDNPDRLRRMGAKTRNYKGYNGTLSTVEIAFSRNRVAAGRSGGAPPSHGTWQHARQWRGVLRRVAGKLGARLSAQSVADIVKVHAERVGLDPGLFAGHSLRAGFLTSAAKRGASIFKMMDQSRHKSVDTLRGYVRDAEIFKDHAGAGLL